MRRAGPDCRWLDVAGVSVVATVDSRMALAATDRLR